MSRSPGQDQRFEEALSLMGSLYSSALRLTRSPERAEDLLQDTYLKAYRAFDRFQPGTNLRAWLYTILLNTYRNRLRHERRIPEQTEYDEVEPYYELVRSEHAPVSGTPEQAFLEYASVERITRAIEQLPEPFREVIELVCVQEFAYKEVCEMLDVPIGTVMSRIHRGRKLLQGLLLAESRGGAPRSEAAT